MEAIKRKQRRKQRAIVVNVVNVAESTKSEQEG